MKQNKFMSLLPCIISLPLCHLIVSFSLFRYQILSLHINITIFVLHFLPFVISYNKDSRIVKMDLDELFKKKVYNVNFCNRLSVEPYGYSQP
jgi:hypothetical protein